MHNEPLDVPYVRAFLFPLCPLLRLLPNRSNAFFEGLKASQDLQMHVTGACTTLYQLR